MVRQRRRRAETDRRRSRNPARALGAGPRPRTGVAGKTLSKRGRRAGPAGRAAAVFGLRAAVRALRWLGPTHASNLGGWVARLIGPRLPVSRIADANLRRALPRLDATQRRQVIRAVWDNLGRNTGEMPHLAGFQRTSAGPGWEIAGEAHLAGLSRPGSQAVFFSGHLGNWEMILPIAAALGIRVGGFYRAGSNVAADRLIQSLRQAPLARAIPMFAKGRDGTRGAVRHMRDGGSLGFLVDQKMNDGIAVDFFGQPAMTATGMAKIALRYGCPIIPVRVQRLGPARFRLICEPPLTVVPTGAEDADVHAATLAMNQTLERWIRADPGAWLWLHRRWPKPVGETP